MEKLTIPQAIEIVKKSLADIESNKALRLGQQIWNNLGYNGHTDITDRYQGTDKDFFYWLDNSKVLACLYQNFVDCEEKD